jgi:hypothetical protein
MKRLLSFLLLAVLSCTVLDSCQHMSGPSYIGEYAGHIQTTITDDPMALSGFYVDLSLFDDNTCVLMTAVILEDNYTLDAVRYQNFKYGNVSEAGFDVINGSGVVVATARYCGPFNFPEGEINLTWDGIICSEWGRYAVPYGWDQPCHMNYYSQNGSDIKGW